MTTARIVSVSKGSVPCEFTTRLAVDAGFSVVKLETPEGDPLRAQSPELFAFLAAGKESVAVPQSNLRKTLEDMADSIGAIVVDEWGRDQIGSDLSVPVVVVGERDGSALQGMLAQRGDEFLAFHGTGLGFLTPRVMPGYPSGAPLCPDAHLVEFLAGLYGSIALFALLRRPSAAVASVGLTGATLPLLRREVAAVLYEGAKPSRAERIWKVSPAEVHRCADGWIFVDVIEDEQWIRLCDYMDRPDLAANKLYATREQRFAQADSLCSILDAFFADKPKSCWMDAQARGVPVAPVNGVEDLTRDVQLHERGFWTRIDHFDGRAMVAPSTPLASIYTSGSLEQPLRVPAIGEHTKPALRRAIT